MSTFGAPTTAAAAADTIDTSQHESQWALMKKRFRRHKLAIISMWILAFLYGSAILGSFLAPTSKEWRDLDYTYAPPQLLSFSFEHGLHAPELVAHEDPISLQMHYRAHEERVVPLTLFASGEPHHLLGFIPTTLHLIGVDQEEYREAYPDVDKAPRWYPLGADRFGRDLMSRLIYGGRISLFIGLVALVITFLLGITIGGISGYVGGTTDNVIQRGIEIINSFPKLPLWLALAAALPSDWSGLQIYFAITIVLALLTWTMLARQVRGKILSLREEDYVVAAKLLGANHKRILFVHLVPGFTSHIVVVLTLMVPAMILGETALSFLGLGLRPPIVSWGVLLQDCMNMQTVANYPWMLLPVLAVGLTVLAFNFLGDGLRDAADPYAAKT